MTPLIAHPALAHLSVAQHGALAQALDWITQTLDPAGIAACGSLVRGEGHAGSDLDLVVLWRRPGRQRLQRWFGRVPVEIFANSAAWLRHTLHAESGARPVLAHMLATGVLLRDDDGTLATVVTQSQALLQAGPAHAEDALTRMRYAAASAVEDALDLAERDDADARLARLRALDQLLGWAYAARGQFLPPAKRRMARLAAVDAAAAALLQAVVKARNPASAALALRTASQALLGCSGFFEWTSAVQDDPTD